MARTVTTPDASNDWMSKLLWEQSAGKPPRMTKCAENAAIILEHDPRWRGRIHLDTFAQNIRVSDTPFWRPESPFWADTDDTRLQGWLIREHGLNLSVQDCARAVAAVAEALQTHPVRDWMEGLEWDGTPRLARWLADYLGCPESEYAALVGKWWLVSAVARTYRPGCKADCMLILYGKQGVGKSTALSVLAGEGWFSDTPFDIENEQRAGQALCGVLIYEFGELATWSRTEMGRIKNFCSSPDDKFREPYGRVSKRHPRQCIFAGTTNHSDVLKDETGSRRFWVAETGAVDIGSLREDREQLWAEAVHAYKAGDRWWPEGERECAILADVQSRHRVVDDWETVINDWASGRDEVTSLEVLIDALRFEKSKCDRAAQMRVAAALKQTGWELMRVKRDGRVVRVFRRIAGVQVTTVTT